LEKYGIIPRGGGPCLIRTFALHAMHNNSQKNLNQPHVSIRFGKTSPSKQRLTRQRFGGLVEKIEAQRRGIPSRPDYPLLTQSGHTAR
jgi:hypothetical protein